MKERGSRPIKGMGVWTVTSYFPRELLQLVNFSKSLGTETPYYGLFRPNLTTLGKVKQLLWKNEYHKLPVRILLNISTCQGGLFYFFFPSQTLFSDLAQKYCS